MGRFAAAARRGLPAPETPADHASRPFKKMPGTRPAHAEANLCPSRRLAYRAGMFLKFLALLAAAIPIVLFVRKVFFRRETKLGATLREFKKQVDLAIWIFLGLIGVVLAFALGKIAWTWWTAV